MKLTEQEIKTLIKNCQLTVEKAYETKLDERLGGDEYFKRGFLLGCQELTKCMINVLNQYQVIKNGD